MSRLSIAVLLFVSACTRQQMARELPSTTPSTAMGPPAVDLPCEAADLLAQHCWTCHGASPVGESPMSLLTYADLIAPSVTEPEKSMAEEALLRLQASDMPMPPPPTAAIPADQLAAFKSWVDGGMHGGSCQVQDPFGTPSTCTSGTIWDNGDDGSSRMHPGVACIDCHGQTGGPRLKLAGTVFPSAHEPDDCNGQSGVHVIAIGADGKQVTMSANGAGNFYSQTGVTLPYTIRLTGSGGERAMATPQMSGDCNGCHTQNGDEGAPGRIVAP